MATCSNHDCRTSTAETPARIMLLVDSTALIVLAVFLLYSALTGRLRWFLAPAYQWLPPVAGVALIAMAVTLIVGQRGGGAPCACPTTPPRRTLMWHGFYAMVLLAAVVMALAVDPQQFTVEGMRKRLVTTAARDAALDRAVSWILGAELTKSPAASEAVLPPNPNVRDLLDAAAAGNTAALQNQFVTLIGQCSFSSSRSDSFDLYRVVVVCCVADAQSLSLQVTNADCARLEPGQWVRVSGLVGFNDLQLPVLRAERVEKTAAPPAPYL
jgi:uncharacterized repeat protein (TIGR03943 family)